MSLRPAARDAQGRPLTFEAPNLAALGVPHAFSTRRAGCPEGREDQSFGFWGANRGAQVHESWRQLASRAGAPGHRVHYLRQVHGSVCSPVDGAGEEDPAGFLWAGEGDGLTCEVPGQALAVVTADCVPVLVALEAGRRVAAVHAGWRGAVAGVLTAGLGQDPGQVSAVALGPHIRRCCFEIGEEVAERFEARAAELGAPTGRVLARKPGARPHGDIEGLLVAELRAAGVPDDRVVTGSPCTHCDPQLFFSYRRDGPGRGLLGHLIAPRAKAAPHDS